MRPQVRLAPAARVAACMLVLGVAVTVPTGSAWAQSAPKASAGTLLPGATSKDPVSIDAGKLDYFDKEQKLVYSGDVVARQGESTLKASALTIFLSRSGKKEDAPENPGGGLPAGNSVSHMEAAGPVTILSKDEVGTGDSGVYDKGENRITLLGNVTLSQATNVIRGNRLVYDLTTGRAQVFGGGTTGRVQSVFTPGSGAPGQEGPGKGKRPATPVPHAKPAASAARP